MLKFLFVFLFIYVRCNYVNDIPCDENGICSTSQVEFSVAHRGKIHNTVKYMNARTTAMSAKFR